jgi:hypothetical protein
MKLYFEGEIKGIQGKFIGTLDVIEQLNEAEPKVIAKQMLEERELEVTYADWSTL